jgi:hypothetical protein
MEHPCSTLPLTSSLPSSFIHFIHSILLRDAPHLAVAAEIKIRITNRPINALPVPLAMAKDKDNPPDKHKKLKKALAL